MTDLCFPVRIDRQTKWTVGFDDPREDHIHGAADICGIPGTELLAVCTGTVYHQHIEIQSESIRDYNAWGLLRWRNNEAWPFVNYRVSIFGVVAVLVASDHSRMAVYAHLDPDDNVQWFEQERLEPIYHKKSNTEYISGVQTAGAIVHRGDVIGYMGNAGYTLTTDDKTGGDPKGTHLHFELHDGTHWNAHSAREIPEHQWPKHWAQRWDMREV